MGSGRSHVIELTAFETWLFLRWTRDDFREGWLRTVACNPRYDDSKFAAEFES